MRKIFLFMSLSLDGYFEGPDHDISWHNVDDEFTKLAIEQLKRADTFLWGRRTYQLMEASWPRLAVDPGTSKDNLEIARIMNHTRKIVFSRTLDQVHESAEWTNVKLVRELDLAEIERLKDQPGKDICVGGSNLALSLIKSGLIDEFRFTIVPIIIGTGTPIFAGLRSPLRLELLSIRKFASGNVHVVYRPSNIKA